jgi:hypothetical protein
VPVLLDHPFKVIQVATQHLQQIMAAAVVAAQALWVTMVAPVQAVQEDQVQHHL